MSFEASLIFGNVARGGPSDNSDITTFFFRSLEMSLVASSTVVENPRILFLAPPWESLEGSFRKSLDKVPV